MAELWGLALHPMLAMKEERPFSHPDWIFEVKWDGTRALCFYDGGRLKFQNRRLFDITYRYPEIQVQSKAQRAIFDGEIVIMHEGRPSFEKLQLREHLQITELDHKRIESDVLGRVLGTMEDERKTYRDVLRHARSGGKITQRVRETLDEVRRLLHIPKDEAERIEREVAQERAVPA